MKKSIKIVLILAIILVMLLILTYFCVERLFNKAVENREISNCCGCKGKWAMYDVCCDCTETLNIYEKLLELLNKK